MRPRVFQAAKGADPEDRVDRAAGVDPVHPEGRVDQAVRARADLVAVPAVPVDRVADPVVAMAAAAICIKCSNASLKFRSPN